MTKTLSHQKEHSLLDSFLSSRVEARFTEDKKGKPMISSLLIGGVEMSPEMLEDNETVNTFFNSIAILGGGLDPETTITFLTKTADALPSGFNQDTFNRSVALFQKMKPQDPVEARLLAQHFILHEQGMKFLHLCSTAEILPQSQYFGTLSMKMLKLSQESIQALTKYRNKGTQQINIVHMQDNAKAVMVGGYEKK